MYEYALLNVPQHIQFQMTNTSTESHALFDHVLQSIFSLEIPLGSFN